MPETLLRAARSALRGRGRRLAGRRATYRGRAAARSPRSIGGGAVAGSGSVICELRDAVRIRFKHVLVAIRYSQVRSDALPWNVASPRHAASRVSCTASSASSNEPSIRWQWTCSSCRYGATSSANAASSPERARSSSAWLAMAVHSPRGRCGLLPVKNWKRSHWDRHHPAAEPNTAAIAPCGAALISAHLAALHGRAARPRRALRRRSGLMPDRGSRLKLLAALGGSLTRAANRDRRIRAPGTPGPVLAPKQCPDRGPACGLLRGCQEPLRRRRIRGNSRRGRLQCCRCPAYHPIRW